MCLSSITGVRVIMEYSTTRRTILLIFCILLIAYAYVLPRRVDRMQFARLSLVRALTERGTVQIDAYVSKTDNYAIYNGHAYSEKPPGPALMGLMVYAGALPLLEVPAVNTWLEWLAGEPRADVTSRQQDHALRVERIRRFMAQYLLTLVVIAVPAAAAGALLYRFLEIFRVSHGLRLLLVMAYGLGTPAATYAGNFYSHQLVASLCLGAFVLLVWLAQGQGGAARALLAGLLMGYAVISEYPAALIVAVLGIYAWQKLPWSLLRAVLIGGMLPVALLVVYNLVAFGTPLPVSYAYSVLHRSEYQTGFMSITYPQLEALWGLTFSPFRGLFVRAPWLLPALPGYLLWWRRGELRAELLVAVGVSAGMLLLYASAARWWGGAAAGPRYLVSSLPFLALGVVPLLRVVWDAAMRYRLAIRSGIVLLVLSSVMLTWSEAVAGHVFPAETLRTPWSSYVRLCWQAGYITENLGIVLGLPPLLSLLPPAIIVATLVTLTALLGHSVTNPKRMPAIAPNPAFEG